MRQRVRKAVIIVTFLSFPIVMNFLSPYIIIAGAAGGSVSGSFLLFGFLFLSSLVAGRAYCGWACPVAGIQECLFLARDRRVKKGGWTKWALWVPWVGLVGFTAIRSGGLRKLDPLFLTERGISISEPWMFINYFLVIGVLLALSLAVGKRSFCRHLCWMAPFMIIGTRIKKALRFPSLRLRAEPKKCIQCGRCTKGCTMSLEVQAMVEKGNMFNDECILCGECVDGCPKGVISYTFRGR
jgi:ferredoxin-type protein NapH